MTTPASTKPGRVSQKASRFTESVIREMTREALKHGAVNLSQGFPDFPAPEEIKRAAMQAIADDLNQYIRDVFVAERLTDALFADSFETH